MKPKNNTRVKNDLTKKLASIIADKKVLVQVDAANIYFSAQQKNWSIDFKNIATWFKEHSNQTDLVYYTAFDTEDEKQNQYLLDMAENNYRVFKKPLKIFNDETRKGNLDVEIAIDAMMHIFSFEIFVLLSGDGDFTYLVQTLESLGKKVIIIGIAGFMSYELHSQAGNFFFLDRIKEVWQTPKTQQTKETDTNKLKKTSSNSNSKPVKNLILNVDTQKEAQFLSANNLSIKPKAPTNKNNLAEKPPIKETLSAKTNNFNNIRKKPSNKPKANLNTTKSTQINSKPRQNIPTIVLE